jgi:hypothetical protein
LSLARLNSIVYVNILVCWALFYVTDKCLFFVKTTLGPWNSLIKKVNLTLKQSRKECQLKGSWHYRQKIGTKTFFLRFCSCPRLLQIRLDI